MDELESDRAGVVSPQLAVSTSLRNACSVSEVKGQRVS